jgi:RNA polymerase-binding protein DksA
MAADKLDAFRTLLEDERRRVLLNVASLREEFGQSISEETEEHGLDTHLGDQGTITFLRERDLTIEEHEEQLLQSIDDALGRLAKGTYGTCRECGVGISHERLEALPWANTCIECQAAAAS